MQRPTGKPEEVAHAALWLTSADASFVTATDLEVDGGLGGLGAFADPYPTAFGNRADVHLRRGDRTPTRFTHPASLRTMIDSLAVDSANKLHSLSAQGTTGCGKTFHFGF